MKTIAIILVLCTGALPAQAAFTTFGAGCTIDRQQLAIGNQGLPRIGTSFQITYTGPNFTFSSAQRIAQPFLALGLAQATTVIPRGLFPGQPAGCTGFIDPVATLPTPVDPAQPIWQPFLDVSVPNNPALIGGVFFAQWVTVVQQCGFAGCGFDAVGTSDAGRITVGV